MNRLPFTKYASKALNEGREIAGYLGFKDVSSIFVLLGLYAQDARSDKRINRRSDQREVKDAKRPKKNGNGYSEDRIPVRNCRRTCNEIRV